MTGELDILLLFFFLSAKISLFQLCPGCHMDVVIANPDDWIPPVMNSMNQFSPYASQNSPLTWMQYGACQPTSFLELLQNNNIGHLVSDDVQALNNNVFGQALDSNVYTEGFDNFMV